MRSRSVFSSRFHQNQEQRRESMLRPVPEGSTSALNVLERMGNAVPRIEKIRLHPYTVPTENGMDEIELDAGAYALARFPGWEKDRRAMHLATVSENYQVITPHMMAEGWDSIIGQTPSNLQFQRGGTAMLMELKMDEFAMKPREERKKGDILERYFFVMNPTDGGGSVLGGVREVRLACTNGILRYDKNVETFKIKHDATAYDHMLEWMAFIWNHFSKTPISAVAQAYNALTESRATIETIRWINTELYPLPEMPSQDDWNRPRKTTYADALANWEYRSRKVTEQHEAIEGLWNGGGTDIDGETAWGALNTFTEWSNYRKGTSDTVVAETINGDRAREMQQAWKLLQQHLESPVLS